MPKTFADLVELMDRLRSPGGCPWDREQTYATLAPMLLEEAYEAFDALEEARLGRPDDLREELGDLLFQITFFARVAQERGWLGVRWIDDNDIVVRQAKSDGSFAGSAVGVPGGMRPIACVLAGNIDRINCCVALSESVPWTYCAGMSLERKSPTSRLD
jgi:NTP pyrophosphatase (non-canonical NTP hydrolase)